MKIYRVEHMSVLHTEGFPSGPYQNNGMQHAEHALDFENPNYSYWDHNHDDCIHEWMENMCYQTGLAHPTPNNDGIYDFDTNHIFGFKNLDSLKEWFSGNLRILQKYGFVIAVYEVPDHHAQHGYRQSVFNYTHSKRIDEKSILCRS